VYFVEDQVKILSAQEYHALFVVAKGKITAQSLQYVHNAKEPENRPISFLVPDVQVKVINSTLQNLKNVD